MAAQLVKHNPCYISVSDSVGSDGSYNFIGTAPYFSFSIFQYFILTLPFNISEGTSRVFLCRGIASFKQKTTKQNSNKVHL